VAIYKGANNALSLLAAALTPTSTSLQVLSGHGARFPLIGANEYTRVTIQDTANRKEIVEVTQRMDGADTMTVVRGREGTIPLEWAAGALVECRPTVGVVATVDGAQAMQNKIIDGSKNTLLNVGVKELLSGVVGVDNFMGTLTGITAYTPGQRFWFTVPAPNTGPCTLSVNGMLALPLVKDRARALQAGDLRAGDLVCAFCDGSRFWMIYGSNGLSSAVEEALGLKAPLASPVFTGTVKVPEASDPASPVRLGQMAELIASSRRGQWFMEPSAVTTHEFGLLLNGLLASKETYAKLWAKVQARGEVVSEAVWQAGRKGLYADYSEAQFRLPDVCGRVIRAHHNGSNVDPDFAARVLGSVQGDAIRELTGEFLATYDSGGFQNMNGVFEALDSTSGFINASGRYPVGLRGIRFKASNTVPTAAENRMTNISTNFFVYF
jgi:hypothetical protein